MKLFTSLLMAVVVLCCIDVSAAEVDATAARAVAENLLQSRLSGKMRAGVQPNLVLAHAEPASSLTGAMDYYVFNTSDGSAFVIVAGDDRAEAVLGYGDGAIDMASLPSNVQWWLDQYKRQMECLRDLPEEQTAAPPCRSSAEELTVAPLLTCKWSQNEPYYDQCALYEGERCATGCVATAMAMVMDFWKYPETLPALPAYYTTTLHIPIEALPGVTLDWENMKDDYSRGYTEAQGAAVATLMRYCSQACMMDCSPEGSSSSGFEQLMAFKKFGYNSSARFMERDSTTAEEWIAMISSELAAGHPIPYCGRGDNGGHAFVLDGCENGLYHFNWGWGGVCNGYFVLDILKPYQGYDFSYEQDMNFQVYPDDGSVPSLEPAYDFEVDGIYYLENGNEAKVTYRDMSFNSYSGEVEIPETVTHDGKTYQVTAIGGYAFAGCESLTSVKMPFIEQVDDYAFTYCSGLHSLTLGKAFKSLGRSSFYGIVALDHLEVMDIDAFASNDFDSYYTNPLVYARRLYHNGEEVTDLVIHNSAGRVGANSFMFCESFKSLTIEDGVKSIGDNAFYYCSSLERIEIGPDSIGMDAFLYDYNVTELILHEGVKQMGPFAFYGISRLKELELPTTLESVENAAFAFCDSLEHVVFKGGDTKLEGATFYGCALLTDVKMSPEQTSISTYTFGECTALQNLDLGQSLDSIGEYAFISCTSLGEVTLPITVTKIAEDAFLSCSGLSQVNILDLGAWCAIDFGNETANPLYLAHKMVVDGKPVSDLVLPDGLRSINRNAFAGCTSLQSVTLPASVTAIGNSAFKGCNGLTRVQTPNLESWCAIDFGNETANPLSLARHLFLGDEELTNLVLPESVGAIGNYTFANCAGLTDVTVGNHVTAIGDFAFGNCENLAGVAVGDGVKSIGEWAFAACNSLEHVTLGSGLETIATKAFSQSMSITDITCKATVPPVLGAKDCFPLIAYKKALVTVPRESLQAYRGANFWDQFKNFVVAPLVGDVNRDGEVSVADVNATIAQCHAGTPDMVADVNGDGEVNIADVNAVIDLIFRAK